MSLALFNWLHCPSILLNQYHFSWLLLGCVHIIFFYHTTSGEFVLTKSLLTRLGSKHAQELLLKAGNYTSTPSEPAYPTQNCRLLSAWQWHESHRNFDYRVVKLSARQIAIAKPNWQITRKIREAAITFVRSAVRWNVFGGRSSPAFLFRRSRPEL